VPSGGPLTQALRIGIDDRCRQQDHTADRYLQAKSWIPAIAAISIVPELTANSDIKVK